MIDERLQLLFDNMEVLVNNIFNSYHFTECQITSISLMYLDTTEPRADKCITWYKSNLIPGCKKDGIYEESSEQIKYVRNVYDTKLLTYYWRLLTITITIEPYGGFSFAIPKNNIFNISNHMHMHRGTPIETTTQLYNFFITHIKKWLFVTLQK